MAEIMADNSILTASPSARPVAHIAMCPPFFERGTPMYTMNARSIQTGTESIPCRHADRLFGQRLAIIWLLMQVPVLGTHFRGELR